MTKQTVPMPWWERRADEVVQLGDHVQLAAVGALAIVWVRGLPVLRFARHDALELRAELASLATIGVVPQAQVIASGLVPRATFQRDVKAYRAGGREALMARARMGRRPGPSKLMPEVVGEIRRLLAKKDTVAEIARQVGMSERSVARQRDADQSEAKGQSEWVFEPATTKSTPTEQPETSAPLAATDLDANEIEAIAASLPVEAPPIQATSESTEVEARPAESSQECAERIALQRRSEFIVARMGRIEEQSALFPPVEHARHAGVLLALALLGVTGLVTATRTTLGVLPNGFYGVRSILTTLVAMALLRCKRPEQLKGFDPTVLGAVLGLVRAPEMKTLRRKHKQLAKDEVKVRKLVHEMARRHVARVKDAIGFLYVDGHVRPYFGDKELSKTHVAAMRICLPATTDYWVSDTRGEPLLVLVTEGNAAMTKALPGVLDEVRGVVGAEVEPTVVFDRGGYSAELFKLIRLRHFHFLTYRKGRHAAFVDEDFHPVRIRRNGRETEEQVSDRHIELPGYGSLRCVALRRSDGGQTQVLTSREDLSAREVLERMFSRWQQENFFKYLKESFAFDALWTYEAMGGDPTRTVPNPARGTLGREIADLRRKMGRHQLKLSECVAHSHPLDSTRRAKELAEQAEALAPLVELQAQVVALRARRAALPERVAIRTLRDDGQVLELVRAPMLLGDVIKMTAYHIETMLLTAVGPHLHRANEEGRAFLTDVMQLDGRLTPGRDRLTVTLKSPSAPRYRRALEALCAHINELKPTFPETTMRLHFGVAGPTSPT